MSILNLILDQAAIMFTLGLAVAILVVAIVIAIVLRARTISQKRAEARAQQKAAQQQAARMQTEDEDFPLIADAQEVPTAKPADGPTPQAAAAPITPETAPEAQEAEQSDAPDEQVNSLLADVFQDEMAGRDFGALLDGIEPPTIDELLALATHVSEQLHQRRMAR
jgi:predicted lipid-binding transport protein (Tim44 family)